MPWPCPWNPCLPFISLHVGGLGRVRGILVSACPPLSPYMIRLFGWPLPGCLGSLSPLVSPCSPHSNTVAGLHSSPFVSFPVGCFCRVPGHLVSACLLCLPSCGFPYWVLELIVCLVSPCPSSMMQTQVQSVLNLVLQPQSFHSCPLLQPQVLAHSERQQVSP